MQVVSNYHASCEGVHLLQKILCSDLPKARHSCKIEFQKRNAVSCQGYSVKIRYFPLK